MKPLLLFILLVSFFGNGLQTISRTNRFAREAASAYQQQDYAYAITAYNYLLNELEVQDDQIRLNLAHAYFKAHELGLAKEQYQLLADHPSQRIRALASLQLGNVATMQKQFDKALSLYRNALIAEPGNESARYNYELLKKYLLLHPELIQQPDEAPEQPLEAAPIPPDPLPAPAEQDSPAPKLTPDAQGTDKAETDTREQSENGSAEGKAGQNQQENDPAGNEEREEAAGTDPGKTLGQNQQDSTANNLPPTGGTGNLSEKDQRARMQRERLQQMNLTPEKAQLLLDAMRNAELQYIQQLPRKSTRKPDKSAPDW